ncbi:MAG: WXG100 family type VII secretion target [Hamadaea sp.]|uniref:WXG100 family type VII secretion target n=1 Tax=Hamadaea sp. TaxID=2024425 RepID=UPI0018343C40|nr:WXG100 family type VII secretion target [Hamadaea sp.]NUR72438.1 WXG100 family type VII secretion target [Hamadaea sp.]NUT19963.1 WXG100 family type VII secretion target [Hamadaea sp.]
MSFTVEPASLAKLPQMLDRFGEDASKGKDYVKEKTAIGWSGQGLLNLLEGTHDKSVSTVTDWLSKVDRECAKGTSTAVTNALVYYRQTDEASAAKLDSTYPSAEVETPYEGYQYYAYNRVADFADKTEPQSRYKEIEDHSAEFQYQPSMLDLGSPTMLARDIIFEASEVLVKFGLLDKPYDLFDAMMKVFAGDWVAFRGCKDVFDNVADACEDMASNLHWAARSIQNCWEGNAAEGCENHIFKINEAMTEAAEPLRKLGEEYEKSAEAMEKLGAVVADLVADAMDEAILVAADGAAAAATSETIIGGVIFGSVALYECYKLLKTLKEIFEIPRKAQALIELFESAANGMGTPNGGAMPELPWLSVQLPNNPAPTPPPEPEHPTPSPGPSPTPTPSNTPSNTQPSPTATPQPSPTPPYAY